MATAGRWLIVAGCVVPVVFVVSVCAAMLFMDRLFPNLTPKEIAAVFYYYTYAAAGLTGVLLLAAWICRVQGRSKPPV